MPTGINGLLYCLWSCTIYPTVVSTSYRLFSKSISGPVEWVHLNLLLPFRLWVFQLSQNWDKELYFFFLSSNFSIPSIFDNFHMLRSFWKFILFFEPVPGHFLLGSWYFGFFSRNFILFYSKYLEKSSNISVPLIFNHFPILWSFRKLIGVFFERSYT